jgi:hypothetical protein
MASRRRMSIRQAAAIWILVFLIGLTGGELVRQQALKATNVAVARGLTEPTTATSTPAVNAAAPSATSTATTTTSPPQTTTAVDCDRDSCPDDPGRQGPRRDGGKGRGHGDGLRERGRDEEGNSGPG